MVSPTLTTSLINDSSFDENSLTLGARRIWATVHPPGVDKICPLRVQCIAMYLYYPPIDRIIRVAWINSRISWTWVNYLKLDSFTQTTCALEVNKNVWMSDKGWEPGMFECSEQLLFSCVISKVIVCYAIYHMSYFTYHISHITCQTSKVKCLFGSLVHAKKICFHV